MLPRWEFGSEQVRNLAPLKIEDAYAHVLGTLEIEVQIDRRLERIRGGLDPNA